MKKGKFLTLLLALCFIPFGVNAESKTVTTEAELKTALADTTVTEVVLGADIETLGKINITRDVTIDGANHTISYVGKFFNSTYVDGTEDNTVWSSKSSDDTPGAVYVLQAYNCNVTLKDIALANGNRAFGVNGATVTLKGVINVSGNGFHPIEVSSGNGVTNVSTLKLDDETIVINADEDFGDETGNVDGTLYIDNYDANQKSKIIKVKAGVETVEEYANGTRIAAADLNINLLYTIDAAENKEVPADLLEFIKTEDKILSLARVESDELVYTWEFDGKEITDPSIVVNTNITFTLEAPSAIHADIAKVVTNHENLSYLNFEHEGKLPGLAKVSYYVADKYAVGTKVYVAHFNETTKALEKAQEVTVDEDGSITFKITECSSYVLYTGATSAESTGSTTSTVENVKTGDINLLFLSVAIVIAGIGLVVTGKKLVAKVK